MSGSLLIETRHINYVSKVFLKYQLNLKLKITFQLRMTFVWQLATDSLDTSAITSIRHNFFDIFYFNNK